MDNPYFFWICWSVELVALLVIGFDGWQRYAQREQIPMAPDQWKAGRRNLGVLLMLLVGGLVLRAAGYPQWALYLVASPLALLLAFFLIAGIGILFGARTN